MSRLCTPVRSPPVSERRSDIVYEFAQPVDGHSSHRFRVQSMALDGHGDLKDRVFVLGFEHDLEIVVPDQDVAVCHVAAEAFDVVVDLAPDGAQLLWVLELLFVYVGEESVRRHVPV